MARPQKNRRVCDVPASDRFIPVCGPPGGNSTDPADPAHAVILSIDEYEALRLIDHEGLTHSECAVQMNISRTTATEICESARRKVAEAIVSGRGLVITGGSWELCSGGREDCIRIDCPRAAT